MADSSLFDDGVYMQQSDEGLWCRSWVEDESLVAEYQVRTRLVGGAIEWLDANGEVIERHSARSGATRPEWSRYAEIVVSDDALYEFGGEAAVEFGDDVREGLARHLVDLVVGGFGDDVDEVASWFEDLTDCEWIAVGASYIRIGDVDDSRPGDVLDGIESLVVVGASFDEVEVSISGNHVTFEAGDVKRVLREIAQSFELVD